MKIRFILVLLSNYCSLLLLIIEKGKDEQRLFQKGRVFFCVSNNAFSPSGKKIMEELLGVCTRSMVS
ncbi:hypothetical protein SFC66_11230 [Terribacillus saccharophilus]|uniref:hypothetical protein n=1 Tax=Terribacillus saccharophilus TaxID=361277 RepID=UPI003981E6B8